MEIPFAEDHTAEKQKGISNIPLSTMKFDAGTEESIHFQGVY